MTEVAPLSVSEEIHLMFESNTDGLSGVCECFLALMKGSCVGSSPGVLRGLAVEVDTPPNVVVVPLILLVLCGLDELLDAGALGAFDEALRVNFDKPDSPWIVP
jgi:hypothetical protein